MVEPHGVLVIHPSITFMKQTIAAPLFNPGIKSDAKFPEEKRFWSEMERK